MTSIFDFANPCRRAQRGILEDLDEPRGLDESTEEHLRSCGHCREYRNDHREIRAAIPRDAAPEPSSSFTDRALSAWRAQERTATISAPWIPQKKRVEPWTWAASVAAGILLVGGLSWFAISPASNSRSTPGSAASVARVSPIGRSEMFPVNRDVAVLGFAFPSRSQKIWNLR